MISTPHNLIAIGAPGVGKSNFGNTIVGVPGHFKSGKSTQSGLTKTISSLTKNLFGDPNLPTVTWYDSPGVGDLQLPML